MLIVGCLELDRRDIADRTKQSFVVIPVDVLFSLDVFNLFNSQNATVYNEYAETSGGAADEDYGLIRQYQRPRYVRFSTRVLFE